ncbi:Choline dehydrogenase [Corynebacterium casei]|uniref:GMC family oxidoreductase n=5 Tax=Corynebacterium casei TaxID=160386 RepID=UPI0009CD33FD|nr:GMC family oxidoreductase [Corynebacterium casei]SLM89853.1 Choline dehydrogenase [Corynebacterium casei]
MAEQNFDFIIAGAGSSGNVIARRLIDAGQTVAIIEAGPYDTNPDITKVYDLGKLWHSEQDWDYRTLPQAYANNRELHIPRGKVMGGSHALNATIWVRGAKEDYDTWAYLGCDGWSWDEVLPAFKAIENYPDGAPETRGHDGLLDVRSDYETNPLQDAMLEAGQQAGIPLNEDYNSGNPEGIGRIQANVRDGNRFNTWHAYLKPVADHDNLTIITDAKVQRVIIDGDAVTGVEIRGEGGIEKLYAHETILCAGTLNSPEIVLRSGIGPAEELEALGVTVTHNLPGVGKNLHDHVLSPVIFEATENEIPASAVLPAEVHVFTKSTPGKSVPDTQPLYFSIPMYNEDMEGPANAFTLMGGLCPASRGELTLTGPEDDDPIALDLGVLSVQSDMDALVASVKESREVGRQEALAEWGQ